MSAQKTYLSQTNLQSFTQKIARTICDVKMANSVISPY